MQITNRLNELGAEIVAKVPINCNGAAYTVQSNGICTFAQRTDEGNNYLFGPVFTSGEADFVTLDDDYQVQFAFVLSEVSHGTYTQLGSAQRQTDAYNVSLIVATYINVDCYDTIRSVLSNTHGITLQTTSFDTIRNVQQFWQPNVDELGVDPMRFCFVLNFQYLTKN